MSGYHPACLLFPEGSREELRELADDIKDRGLQRPIQRCDGMVLDGRRRLAACKLAGVEPHFEEWNGNGSPLEWVIGENLIRRHLTSSQRAVIACGLLPLLEKEAKERQRLSRGRGKTAAKKLATLSAPGKASQIAARLTKTNSAYIESVKAVSQQAPELLEEIRQGRLKVPDAVTLAQMPKAKRQRVVRMIQAGNGKLIARNELEGTGDRRNAWETGNQPELSVGDRATLLRAGQQSPAHGIVYTPPHVARFLFDLLLPLRPKIVLDVASGNGALSRPWRDFAEIIEYEIGYGKDFFECPDSIPADLVLCNPPFGDEKNFLRRVIEVVPETTPIALVATHRVRLGSYVTSADWRWCRDEWPSISSIVSLPRGVFKGVNETVEVLLFRAPGLAPHYFLPSEVEA
jgi:hypothetical protein